MTTSHSPPPNAAGATSTVLLQLSSARNIPRATDLHQPEQDRQLATVHGDILRSSGSVGNHWCTTSSRWLETPAAGVFKQQLEAELDHRRNGNQTAVTLPVPATEPILTLWQQVLTAAAIDTIYLIPILDPFSASDLAPPNQPHWKSRLMWLRSLLDVEHSTRELTRVIDCHQRPEPDWPALATEAASRFDLDPDDLRAMTTGLASGGGSSSTAVTTASADPTAEPTSAATPSDAPAHELIDDWTHTAWQAVQQLATQDNASNAFQALDTLRQTLEESCAAFGELFQQIEQQRSALQRRDLSQGEKLKRLTHDLDIAEARIDELSRANQQVHEQQAAGLLRLDALQTSGAWRSAKPVHWIEVRRPGLVRRISAGIALLAATVRGRGAVERRQQARRAAILASGLFDRDRYVMANPEVIAAGSDPLTHWMGIGWREGRNPHPLFDLDWYLAHHPELDQAERDPLTHYLESAGASDPSPLFDSAWYLEQTPEAAASGLTPLAHYLRHYSAAAASPSPLFDQTWYLEQSPDVVATGANPLVHYLEHGAAAGRDPCPLFSSSWYLERYPDVAADRCNPLVHFIRIGAAEQRDPGPLFDTAWYVQQHPEAIANGSNPLAWYLSNGTGLGHLPNPTAGEPPSFDAAPATATLDDSYALSRLLPPWDGDWETLLSLPTEPPRRILVVDDRHPTPDLDSGSCRMRQILICLVEAGHEVVFVGDQPTVDQRYITAIEALGITCFTGRKATLRHLMSRGDGFGTALLSRPGVCARYLPLVRAFAPDARVLYDTVDLHWVRLERAAEVSEQPEPLRRAADEYRRLELSNARAADVTIAITDDERATLLSATPGLEVAVVPNIHQVTTPVPAFAQRKGLFFIGSFGHTPNVEAAHYLVDQVLPLVIEQLPDIQLDLVGSQMTDDVAALASEHVNPIGYVEDVTPCFEQARVFVAPLLHGAGMKGKVGQSLSFGLPVVTTPIGAEGIGLIDGDSALISDQAAGLAERIVQAYSDEALWQRLSRNGQAIIEQHYSPATVARQIAALIAPHAVEPEARAPV